GPRSIGGPDQPFRSIPIQALGFPENSDTQTPPQIIHRSVTRPPQNSNHIPATLRQPVSDMPATRTRTTTFVSAISQNCCLDIFACFWGDTMHQHRSFFKTVITTVAIGLMHTASAGEFRGFDY